MHLDHPQVASPQVIQYVSIPSISWSEGIGKLLGNLTYFQKLPVSSEIFLRALPMPYHPVTNIFLRGVSTLSHFWIYFCTRVLLITLEISSSVLFAIPLNNLKCNVKNQEVTVTVLKNYQMWMGLAWPDLEGAGGILITVLRCLALFYLLGSVLWWDWLGCCCED